MASGGYRIGEIAEATGFPPSTLRYYENEGLLPEPQRTSAGQRVYDDSHVERLRFLARGKRLGLTLEEISHLADAWDHEDCSITHDQLVGLLDAKLAHVHEEIVELTRFAEQLEQVYRRVAQRPAEQGRCGPDCGCAAALAADTEPAERRFGELPVRANAGQS
jgi:DNA-binding transcriptional MerR regulator